MKADINRQFLLFEKLKAVIDEDLDLVDELCNLLQISRSSVYKRMRGETVMRINEIQRISKHFNISVDDIISDSNPNSTPFRSSGFLRNLSDVKNYLRSTLVLVSTEEKVDYKFYYGARDLPLFHYFFSDDLARFKIAVWLQDFNPHTLSIVYSDSDEMREVLELGSTLYSKYTEISTIELWTDRTIVNLMNQINTFHSVGKINTEEAIKLCYQTERLLEQIRKAAETGEKINGGKLEMYRIGFLMMTNSALYSSATKKMGFISYAGVNYLTTTQPKFCENMEEWFAGQVANSEAMHLANGFKRDEFFSKSIRRVELLKKNFEKPRDFDF